MTLGNEDVMLTSVELTPLSSITGESIHELFRSAKKANEKNGTPAVPAGPGASKKGEFAMALADALFDLLDNRRDVAVPNHMAEMFTFLYEPHTAEETPLLDEIPTPVAAEPGLDDHNI